MYVFDQAPDSSAANEYHNPIAPTTAPAFRSGSIFVNPTTRQADRRFSYFPPESTQQIPPPLHLQSTQQLEPPAWGSMPLQPSNSPLQILTSPSMPNSSTINESSYFMNPLHNFGSQLYAEQGIYMPDRRESLSFQQQKELMDNLESDAVNFNRIKFT
jgi:hypothetical protein